MTQTEAAEKIARHLLGIVAVLIRFFALNISLNKYKSDKTG